MIRGSDAGLTPDHYNVMQEASSLVNDVIEKARDEVIKRKQSMIPPRHPEPEPTPLRRLSQWQNRAQGAVRRFFTTLCIRIQDITK